MNLHPCTTWLRWGLAPSQTPPLAFEINDLNKHMLLLQAEIEHAYSSSGTCLNEIYLQQRVYSTEEIPLVVSARQLHKPRYWPIVEADNWCPYPSVKWQPFGTPLSNQGRGCELLSCPFGHDAPTIQCVRHATWDPILVYIAEFRGDCDDNWRLLSKQIAPVICCSYCGKSTCASCGQATENIEHVWCSTRMPLIWELFAYQTHWQCVYHLEAFTLKSEKKQLHRPCCWPIARADHWCPYPSVKWQPSIHWLRHATWDPILVCIAEFRGGCGDNWRLLSKQIAPVICCSYCGKGTCASCGQATENIEHVRCSTRTPLIWELFAYQTHWFSILPIWGFHGLCIFVTNAEYARFLRSDTEGFWGLGLKSGCLAYTCNLRTMGGLLQIRPSLPHHWRIPRILWNRPVFTPGGKDNAFLLQQSSWLVEPFMQTVAIGCFCNQRVLG